MPGSRSASPSIPACWGPGNTPSSKDDYLPASKRYTFTVPAVTIPAGGTGEQAQGPDGRPVFHTTLAQRCVGTGGVDIQAQVDALAARVKTLEG